MFDCCGDLHFELFVYLFFHFSSEVEDGNRSNDDEAEDEDDPEDTGDDGLKDGLFVDDLFASVFLLYF